MAQPYISKHIVNCIADRVGDRRPPPRDALLTLAWVCSRRSWSSRVDMNEAPALWDAFFKSAAVRVLRTWDDCVERVVYRHAVTGAAWKSVVLSEDTQRPICKDERGMEEDEWKLV